MSQYSLVFCLNPCEEHTDIHVFKIGEVKTYPFSLFIHQILAYYSRILPHLRIHSFFISLFCVMHDCAMFFYMNVCRHQIFSLNFHSLSFCFPVSLYFLLQILVQTPVSFCFILYLPFSFYIFLIHSSYRIARLDYLN